MNRWIAGIVSVTLGAVLGWVIAHHDSAYGQDQALTVVSVSADGRTVSVAAHGPGVLTVDETPTQVRMRLHLAFWVNVDPGDGEVDSVITARLAAPIGTREIVDELAPVAGEHFLRPSHLPPSYVGVGDTVVFAPEAKLTQAYASLSGGAFTIVQEPGAEPAPPALTADGYTFVVQGFACVLSTSVVGAEKPTSDEMTAIADSMG